MKNLYETALTRESRNVGDSSDAGQSGTDLAEEKDRTFLLKYTFDFWMNMKDDNKENPEEK